jgi:hypothetical protein
MKTKAQIRKMQDRIERETPIGEARMGLIMALEWVLGNAVSTSIGLEDWLDEEAI